MRRDDSDARLVGSMIVVVVLVVLGLVATFGAAVMRAAIGADETVNTIEWHRSGLGAPTALKRLKIAEPVDNHTYVRDKFGYGWLDPDHNHCNTREDVMARDLTAKRTVGCNVVAGTLHDPYTGRVIRYDEHRSWEVQIDHVYPLARAWREGADDWTPTQRRAFANDPRNLLAVDGRANAAKGDSGPGEWMPRNREFVCTYARRYIGAAAAYHLPISPADKTSLRLALGTCP